MPLRVLKVCFFLLLTITPLFFLPWTSELFEFNKLILTYLLTTLIVGFWLLRCILEKRLIFKKSVLDIPLLIFLASSIISFLGSIDPHTSLIGYYGRWNGGLVSLISYCLLYWAYVSNFDASTTKKLLKYTLITASIVSIYGILEHIGFSFSCLVITGTPGVDCWVQDVQNRVFATLGQPNWLAAYLVALIFIPLSDLAKKFRWQSTVITLLVFLCLIATKSRSGFLAFGISSLLFWLVTLKQNSKSFKACLTVLATAILLTLLIKNPIRDYLITSTDTSSKTSGTALESGGTESGEIRKIVWQGAIDIWKESTKTLLIGTGPETFAMAYYNHRPLAHNNTSEWELLYNKAHNEFLNQLSTTGVLGLMSYLVVLGAMAWQMRKSEHIALLSGWLTLSITNFWGFSVITSQLLLFLLPAAALSFHAPDEKHSPSKSKSTLQFISIFLAVFSISYLEFRISQTWLSDLHYASSQKHMSYFTRSDTPDPSDLISAYTQANNAYDLNPNEPFIDTQLADTAAYMAIYLQQSDATSAAQLENLATAATQKALSISPRHPLHYKSAARTYILLSALNPEYLITADKLLESAQYLSPTDPRIPYNRAIIAKYGTDKARAEKFFTDSLKLKPDFGDALVQLRQLASDSAKTKTH